MNRLTGKTIVVTAGYGDIGRATAAIPLREFGTPDQCADAFAFLAGDEADYITGTSLLVDGGASLPRRD